MGGGKAFSRILRDKTQFLKLRDTIRELAGIEDFYFETSCRR